MKNKILSDFNFLKDMASCNDWIIEFCIDDNNYIPPKDINFLSDKERIYGAKELYIFRFMPNGDIIKSNTNLCLNDIYIYIKNYNISISHLEKELSNISKYVSTDEVCIHTEDKIKNDLNFSNCNIKYISLITGELEKKSSHFYNDINIKGYKKINKKIIDTEAKYKCYEKEE